MSKKVVTIAFLVILAVVLVFSFIGGNDSNYTVEVKPEQDMIALITIDGLISGENTGQIFGATSGSMSIMKQLKMAREDQNVKAVLLRINSPGGSASASQEIGVEIDKLKKAGKLVVASMGDVAASGGYWIAAKADKIIANPASMTGSIGVIMQQTDLSELYQKIGIDINVIKSGKFKDIGSAAREMTDEEKELLQTMVDDIFEQFVNVVAEGRNLPKEEVMKIADGRIFTGRQAQNLGLVDELGNFYDAVDYTAELAGIEGEPDLKVYSGSNVFEDFFEIFSMQSLVSKNFLEIY